MVKDMAAVVAAASQSRGIGYQGQMVRTVTFVDRVQHVECHLFECSVSHSLIYTFIPSFQN